MTAAGPPSGYLRHLPAVLRRDPAVDLLLRAVDVAFADLDARIGDMPRHLDPLRADPGFLPWLAGWLGVTVGTDPREPSVPPELLAGIVPLYQRRGTAYCLREMLRVSLREDVLAQDVEVLDDVGPAHFFAVRLTLSEADEVAIRRVEQRARAVVDREKPAHTYYALRISVPTMRLVPPELVEDERRPDGSAPPLLVLGENTVLGSEIGDAGEGGR